MSLAMTRAERESFLADLHVGVISIEQTNAPPLTVPIWYDYAPDIGVWVLTGEDSVKGRALRAAGRYTLCAQTEQPPAYQYVSVEGPVTSVRQADRGLQYAAEFHRAVFFEDVSEHSGRAGYRSRLVPAKSLPFGEQARKRSVRCAR